MAAVAAVAGVTDRLPLDLFALLPFLPGAVSDHRLPLSLTQSALLLSCFRLGGNGAYFGTMANTPKLLKNCL
jgi:hypothetical protein